MRLVREQELVHLPELTLLRRPFGRLGGREGVRMRLFERKMPVREPDPAAEVREQHLHGRHGVLAVRTLEIAVLDDGDERVIGAEPMIRGGDGNGEVEVCGVHLLPARLAVSVTMPQRPRVPTHTFGCSARSRWCDR